MFEIITRTTLREHSFLSSSSGPSARVRRLKHASLVSQSITCTSRASQPLSSSDHARVNYTSRLREGSASQARRTALYDATNTNITSTTHCSSSHDTPIIQTPTHQITSERHKLPRRRLCGSTESQQTRISKCLRLIASNSLMDFIFYLLHGLQG